MPKEYKYSIEVRFRDLDGLGHINNAVYHSYIEQCRTKWLEESELLGKGPMRERFPLILARTEIDYIAQATFGDELTAICRIAHVGTKSFRMSYEIVKNKQLIARAQAVLVWFDFDRNCSVAIPSHVRNVMESWL